MSQEDTEKPAYFIEKELKKDLDRIRKLVTGGHDEDMVILIDGRERSGKSVLALQVAKYLDPHFDLNAVCYTPEDFTKFILSHRKRAVIYDESITGFNVSRRYEKTTVMLDELLAQSGQRNLFTILVVPFFFEVTKRAAVGRSELLIHVYRNEAYKRGHYKVYDYKAKRKLYLLGKRLMEYNIKGVAPNYHGHFPEHYPIDEKAYRKKKEDAFFQYTEGRSVIHNWEEIANWIALANVYQLHKIRSMNSKYDKVAVHYAHALNLPAGTVLNNIHVIKEAVERIGVDKFLSVMRKTDINSLIATIPHAFKKDLVNYKLAKMEKEAKEEEKKLKHPNASPNQRSDHGHDPNPDINAQRNEDSPKYDTR